MNKKEILAALVVIAIAVIFPHSELLAFPFFYVVPILLMIALFLKYRGENFKAIGFSLNRFNRKALFIGCFFGLLFFALSQMLLFPVLHLLFDFQEVEVGLYTKLKGNTSFYIIMLIMGWLIGGLYEEIVFHGFIFTRLEKLISGKLSTVFSFVLTSIIFGYYHIQLGSADAINAFLIGAGYLALILYFKRNLWYGICCHGMYNSLAMTSLYMGWL